MSKCVSFVFFAKLIFREVDISPSAYLAKVVGAVPWIPAAKSLSPFCRKTASVSSGRNGAFSLSSMICDSDTGSGTNSPNSPQINAAERNTARQPFFVKTAEMSFMFVKMCDI